MAASLGLCSTASCLLKRQLFAAAAPCRAATAARLLHPTRSRLLGNSARQLNVAAKSAPRTIKSTAPPPPPKAKPAPHHHHPVAGGAVPPPTRYAFIKSLGTKTTPTILYEAPSHFWFYFGCWSSGITILAWTVLTGPTVVKQPDGVPSWVGYIFGASYVLLGSMAFYLISKTPGVIRTIRLLPVASSSAAAAAAAAPTKTAASSASAAAMPQIEVTVNRMVPILQPRVLVTNLDNVALKSRFSLPDEYVPELRRLERARAAEQARKFDMQHLLTMPFRRIGRAVAGFFRGVRAAWTDMGFATLRVDGKEFKVDVTSGFAHDGFKTLERLVSVGY